MTPCFHQLAANTNGPRAVAWDHNAFGDLFVPECMRVSVSPHVSAWAP